MKHSGQKRRAFHCLLLLAGASVALLGANALRGHGGGAVPAAAVAPATSPQDLVVPGPARIPGATPAAPRLLDDSAALRELALDLPAYVRAYADDACACTSRRCFQEVADRYVAAGLPRIETPAHEAEFLAAADRAHRCRAQLPEVLPRAPAAGVGHAASVTQPTPEIAARGP